MPGTQTLWPFPWMSKRCESDRLLYIYIKEYYSSCQHVLPPTLAVIVHEPRLVCAGHSSVMLALHIKEHPPSSRPSCAPQHASAGPGDRPLFALSGLFGFYSRYPTVVASAEPSVCCYTVCWSVWSSREARLTSTETQPSCSVLLQHSCS